MFYGLEGKKIILMDECHHLLENNVEFVGRMFIELRKQMVAPIALTQNYDDFLNSKIGRVIAVNSFNKIFFRQEIASSDFVTDFDKKKISSLVTKKGEYSEFYLKTSVNRKILRYLPSELEYELFTSDYEENLRQQAFFEHLTKVGFDFNKIIEAWVRIKYALN